MSTENKLAAIPTDQLILELLQELVARVAKLEKRDGGEHVEEPVAKLPQLGDSQGNVIDRPNTTDSTPVEFNANDGSLRCSTCGELLGDSCQCIEVPYGCMFEGEALSKDMKTIEERIIELQEISAQSRFHLSQLEKLGIAAVPVDGRLNFTNFWPLTSTSALQQVAMCTDTIHAKGGFFVVIDFDFYGNYMAYRIGKPLTGRLRSFRDSSDQSFRVLPMKVSLEGDYTAPWKRLIVLGGLSNLRESWAGTKEIFATSRVSDIIVEAHLNSSQSFNRMRVNHQDRCPTNLRIFHLYGYEVTSRKYSDHSTWKHGVLPGNQRWFMQRAHTIAALYHDASPFWTLVVLLPPDSARCRVVEQILRSKMCKDLPLVIVMAEAMYYVLESTWYGWESLVIYIDQLLGTGNEIFDIEAHDELIFDDDLYTRSRRYFWAINCLNESLNVLERNMKVWTNQRDDVLKVMAVGLSLKVWSKFDKRIKKCDAVLEKFVKIKESFNEQRTKAVALRDGLFSASAVMESRASTRLGENVKLLTYVSIFYLPLAFCTSIWSTTDTFGYRNLAITMVVVGLFTYLIVFNLNLLVSFSKSSYSSLKSGIVSSMKGDSRDKWRSNGELFHKYRPRETADESKPSEWWILVYLLQRVLDVVTFRRRRVRKGKEKGTKPWPMLWTSGRQGERDGAAQVDDEANAQV